MSLTSTKPALRGYIHQEAFFFSLGACLILLAETKNNVELIGSSVYSFGLLFLFGMSAIYHRPHWPPNRRALLKRFDHCAIFFLIAGTFTPVCLLGLPKASGDHLLIVIWSAAFLGVIQSIFWVKAPKWMNGLIYICVGWLLLPYTMELKKSIGQTGLNLLFAGGITYTVGALFYILKKPNLKPGIFGYHELFHLMTVVAACLHFAVIYKLCVTA